jgi:hypothetical protein
LNDTHHARINELYDRFGPTPRICFDFLKQPTRLEDHEAHYESALNELTIEKLRDFVSDGAKLNLDAGSHSLFLVKRTNVDDLRKAFIEPISVPVKSELQKRIRLWKRSEQIHLYEHFARVPASRPIAGLVFESMVQSKLQKNVSLELIPMVKWRSDESTNSTEGSQGKKIPQWHSDHPDRSSSLSSTQKTQSPKKRPRTHLPSQSESSDHHSISFSPTKTVEYEGSELNKIEHDEFYVPKSSNQVALDSFIISNGYLYIFQITIASNHSIRPGMVPFFSNLISLPQKTKWRFVFVIPSGSEITCPQPRDPGLSQLLNEMKLFLGEVGSWSWI